MAERRVDPDDGVAYTYEELLAYYGGKYKRKEIEAYWASSCAPAKTGKGAKAKVEKGTGSAAAPAAGGAATEAKAKAKATAKVMLKVKDEGGAEGKDEAKAQATAQRGAKEAKAARAARQGRRRAAVVVDPYSSGKYLLVELHRRRLPVICVRSSRKLSQQFLRSHEANSKYFAEMVEYEDLGGLDDLVAKIEAMPYRIIGVFGGSEPGVELAEQLANVLAMPTANSLDLLQARKDKAEMQEALRRNGVPAAEQFKSGDLEKLLEWAEARNQWPLVAKPTGGAGSDGVYFCMGAGDIKVAHGSTIGAYNSTGKLNSEIVLQEFLAGDEYIVDTVSYEGKHLCVAIWVYDKRKGLPWDANAILSAENRLVDSRGEVQDQLREYVFRVLDATGVRYGPCHTEVMLTSRGPILVEVNARLHGLQGPRLIELATGTSKATYAADVILSNGSLFEKLYQEHRAGRYLYPKRKGCVQLVLHSAVEGFLKTSIKEIILAMELPSVVEVLPAVEAGQFINRSRDLPTAAGTVLMVHAEEAQIGEDIRKIREAEDEGRLYQVSAEPLVGSEPLAPLRSRAHSLESEPSERPRSRLHSLDKAEEIWAAMNEQFPPAAA